MVYFQFRFSSTKDTLLMVLGTVMACTHGVALPAMMLLFGEMTDVFIFASQLDRVLASVVEQFNLTQYNITEDHLKDWMKNNTKLVE